MFKKVPQITYISIVCILLQPLAVLSFLFNIPAIFFIPFLVLGPLCLVVVFFLTLGSRIKHGKWIKSYKSAFWDNIILLTSLFVPVIFYFLSRVCQEIVFSRAESSVCEYIYELSFIPFLGLVAIIVILIKYFVLHMRNK